MLSIVDTPNNLCYFPLMNACRLLDISHLEYDRALDLMRRLAEERALGGKPETLIVTEHDSVITLGKRAAASDLRRPGNAPVEDGPPIHHVERGGLATWHGPGQIVAYPIFHLPTLGMGVADLVNRLEDIIIAVLQEFSVPGRRIPGYPGIWSGEAKIAFIGLAVRKSVAFHGLSLNVDPDLIEFQRIVPCGLPNLKVTSIREQLGRPIPMQEVRTRIINQFRVRFDLNLVGHARHEDWAVCPAKRWLHDQTVLA